MKLRFMAILLLSAGLWAQSGPTAASLQPSGPKYSQLYCSGFITRAKESPHADRFSGRETLFLRGSNLAAGNRYSIVRQVSDPNREDSSPEQRSRLAGLGDLYEDIGWVTVQTVENGTAI